MLQEGEKAGGRDDGNFRGEAVGDLLALALLVDAVRVKLVRVVDVAVQEGFQAEVPVRFLGFEDLQWLGRSEHFASEVDFAHFDELEADLVEERREGGGEREDEMRVCTT